MTWHVYILMQHQQLAILLTMLCKVEHWGRHLYTMEVVRNRETHAGRSATVKMIMASQITGPHLSSSNSPSNHTTLRLQQPTPSSSCLSVEPTRWNCPAYRAGKAPPSTFKYNFVSMDCAMEQ